MRKAYAVGWFGRLGRGLFLPLVPGAFVLGAQGAEAATFHVNSASDVAKPNALLGNGVCETAAGNGVCTLRAAIQEANALAGADTIVLQPVTYTLTISGSGGAEVGDLEILDSLTIEGAGSGSTIIDGNSDVTGDRVLLISPPSGALTVSISGVTVTNGSPPFGAGGGIKIFSSTVTLVDVVVVNNTAYSSGGGIAVYGGSADLTLTNCTISSNNADHGGGIGIHSGTKLTVIDSTISGNTASGDASYGGGVDDRKGSMLVMGSTITGNTAPRGGGISNVGYIGDPPGSSPLVVINSTISGNFSKESGGGLYAGRYSTNALFNVTVTQNRANSDNTGAAKGGGIYADSKSSVTFTNSIVALNELVVLQPFPFASSDDCSGTITSLGFNVMYSVNVANCTIVGGGVTIADPLLGSLVNNGGPTMTHALLQGSPAFETGKPSGCTDDLGAPLTTDQRGFARPSGAHCDIGAFEVQETIFRNGFEP